MSGIAEVLHNLGFKVQGSDIASNYNTERLAKLGVNVHIGHKGENIGGASVVVISSAVKTDNPEVAAAREKFIPVVRRAEMLAELMRLKTSIAVAGTHGKTTTTSLIAAVLGGAGLDPTVINGGIINAHGTNAYLGKSDWMVVEADESDGSFNRLPATIVVVTNIDPEHLDHYSSFEKLKEAFDQFVSKIPFYGFAVLCSDHPEVQAMIGRLTDKRIITYGLNPQADLRAVNLSSDLSGSRFDVEIRQRGNQEKTLMEGFTLPVPGVHNVLNSLSAIAIAHELGASDSVIKTALAGFKGVKRRFTKTGEAGGIVIIDDYGHHPVEITATLKAARSVLPSGGEVIAVVQPHRYSRVKDLFPEFCSCFNDADKVVVADIYPAGEAPIEGIDRKHLAEGIKAFGHKSVLQLEKPEDLPSLIRANAKSGDIVVCMGAGSVTYWAAALPSQLAGLKKAV